jgi:hypothetical protein
MMFRSFVDLVFILLCAVVVILTQSVPLKGLKADPTDVGDGEANSIDSGVTEVLIISDDWIGLNGERFDALDVAVRRLSSDPGAITVVVPEHADVSHHRVIRAWWDLKKTGRHVELGVRPESGASRSS